MKTKLSLLSLLFCGALSVSAQKTDTTYWTTGGLSALTFSQVNLTNWAAGGLNSVALNSNVSLYANRVKGRGKWENSLNLAYGLIKQGEADFEKSDDMINFVTQYGYQINKDDERWLFTGLLDFKTQFDVGFDEDGTTVISRFMAPGYLVVGSGVDYVPNENLSISYIPLTGKFTFVNDQDLADLGAFGVDAAETDADGNVIAGTGKKSRAELGSFFRAQYTKGNFDSRLELFTNYLENFGNIDVNWQNALVVNLTKVISTNFFTQLLYDDDIKIGADDDENGTIEDDEIKPRIQFKSVIGVGIAIKLGASKEG